MSEILPAKFNLKIQDRITAHVQIYQEHWGEEPFVATATAETYPANQEQPFQRRVLVSEQWTSPADVWGAVLSSVGLLLVENRTGQHLYTKPTPDELADIAAAVVTLGLAIDDTVVPFADVPPGLPAMFRVVAPALLRMRCERGRATVMLSAFPR